MSAAVLELPVKANVERAWTAYVALHIAQIECPALVHDTQHRAAITGACERFTNLYCLWNDKC